MSSIEVMSLFGEESEEEPDAKRAAELASEVVKGMPEGPLVLDLKGAPGDVAAAPFVYHMRGLLPDLDWSRVTFEVDYDFQSRLLTRAITEPVQ